MGETGPGEIILLRMYGPLGQHADSVVAPLLVPDVPVVTWWPDEAPPSPHADPLGSVAQRRVTDAAASETPKDLLLTLAKAYQPGDTDLSWTRATSWRSLLAATLDQPYPVLLSGEVLAEPDNPTADLIAAWLGLRLGIEVQRGESGGPGITEVSFETPDGKVALTRPDGRTATLSWPGRPERRVALHRREAPDLIAEELRRLEPDEVYAETLRALAGSSGEGRRGASTVSVPEVIVHRDAQLLAEAVAARLVTRLVDSVAARGTASVVLTGGGIGTKVLAELAIAPARDAIDWSHLDIWWGDGGSPDRPPGQEQDRRSFGPARSRGRRPGPGVPDARRTAPTATTRRRPPPGTRRGWPPAARKITARCPRSTC